MADLYRKLFELFTSYTKEGSVRFSHMERNCERIWDNQWEQLYSSEIGRFWLDCVEESSLHGAIPDRKRSRNLLTTTQFCHCHSTDTTLGKHLDCNKSWLDMTRFSKESIANRTQMRCFYNSSLVADIGCLTWAFLNQTMPCSAIVISSCVLS